MIALALFAQLAIVAHAPDTVSACDAIEVTVAISASGTSTPRIVVPSFAPFEVLRSSTTPHVQLDPRNGGSIIAEYRYVLTTEQVGALTIPPFEARLRGEIARSQPLRIVVRGSRSARVPTVVARARIDTSLAVNFRALTDPDTVYVGQQANYEVAVFLNETVRDRLRRNPTFYPPDMQSMLAYDLPPVSGDVPRRRVGTRCFDALVYQRALFPLVPGRVVIPPAQLVYSLSLSASFFSREESHELLTDSTVIVAIEPPASGRPAEYAGAVGDLTIASRLDAQTGRVGDPMLLTVRVSGTGNVKLFPPPNIDIPWASLVRTDERVRVDSAARRIRGAKEFDWLLTPRIAGELDLPPIRYGFFNPDTRRYAVISSPSARVNIAPGALASLDTARTDAVLSLRPRYRGPISAPPHRQAYFWLALALAPLPAIAGRLRGPRRRVRQSSAVSALRALGRTSAVTCDACQLRRAGASEEVATAAERLLRELDAAAYSSLGALPVDAVSRAQTIYHGADREALPRSELRLPPVMGLVIASALTFGAAAASGLVHSEAQRNFEHGVAAYQAHQYGIARAAFRTAARAEPWAPDAWANLGTAAWALADTAVAISGWQRALRLEPGANDVRERLDLVHSTAFGTIGFVPRLSASIVLWAAIVGWWIAWSIAALLTYRRTPRRVAFRRLAYAVGTIAALLLLAGLDADQRLEARGLGVIRRTTRLSTDPALLGETNGSAFVGEVARATRREGAWVHVGLDGDRDGWIEAANLAPLERGRGED